MMFKNLSFIGFIPEHEKFKGSLSLDAAFDSESDPQTLIKKSEMVYQKYIESMRLVIKDLGEMKSKRLRIPASKIWVLGDNIFLLKKNLENLGLQVDDLYMHLIRDLGVKRKWLEKVVILRRYVIDKNFIPKESNWGMFDKSTAKKARLLQGNK